MHNILFIKDKTFKQFRDTKYYCDEDGNIYSDFSHKILKPLIRNKKTNKQYYYIDINFGVVVRHLFLEPLDE